jgi:hypothetical protein
VQIQKRETRNPKLKTRFADDEASAGMVKTQNPKRQAANAKRQTESSSAGKANNDINSD